MDIRTERATQPVELTDAELDQVVGGVNPHVELNPGGQPTGCPNNKNCTGATGDPHTGPGGGDPH